MSRWFRHYAGMMRDEKLVAVAIRSKQPVERVVWIWGAILESAAEVDNAGRFELDAAEAAYFLRADESDIQSVLDALGNAGRVAADRVVKWSDRQYQSDKSAERQARYRERRRSQNGGGDDHQTHGDVTQTSRDGVVTPQEAETEVDSSDANASSSPEPAKAAPVASSPVSFELPCVSGEPYPVTEADVAEWREAFPAVDIRQQLAAMRSWLNANPTRRKTRKGMRRFAVSWLDRQQNAAHAPSPLRQATSPPKQTVSQQARDELKRRMNENAPDYDPRYLDQGDRNPDLAGVGLAGWLTS